MRKSLGPSEALYPMPVLMVATFDENGTPDVMACAWGGIGDTKELFLCISPTHKTAANIKRRKAFTVSPATAKLVKECDYLGLVSAKSVPDKVAKALLHASKSEKVDAPIIKEFPYTLECRLKSYDDATGKLSAEIVDVNVCDCVLTDGVVDLTKLQPITFDSAHHKYVVLGDPIADAFKVGKALEG